MSLGPLSDAAAAATREALALVPRINARDWTVAGDIVALRDTGRTVVHVTLQHLAEP